VQCGLGRESNLEEFTTGRECSLPVLSVSRGTKIGFGRELKVKYTKNRIFIKCIKSDKSGNILGIIWEIFSRVNILSALSIYILTVLIHGG